LLVAGRIGFFRAGKVDHGQASEDLGKWHLHGPSDDLIGGPSLRVTRLPYAGSTARVSLTLIAGEKIEPREKRSDQPEKRSARPEEICPDIRSDPDLDLDPDPNPDPASAAPRAE